MRSHLQSTKRIVALPLLAILLINVAFAGTAAAEPRIWVVSSSLDRDATLSGEDVPVGVYMQNSGSEGAITVEVTANGTVVGSKWVQMDGNSKKQISVPAAIEEPGRYKIEANGKNAGWLTVTDIRSAAVTNRDDGRTVSLRAGPVENGSSLTAELPDAENQSFAVEAVSMTGTASGFNRSVATYSPADGVPFSVPDAEATPVVGAIEMDSISDVRTSSLRVAVDRAALSESGLHADDVVVYERVNGSYVPLSTSQAATTSEEVVYEASTDGGEQFVVGSLGAAFEVRSTEISTANADGGQRINLTATVENRGAIAANYTAEMVVDGSVVSERTTSIPADERRTITLQHVVSEQGDYAVALGNQSVGSVVVTGDDVSSSSADDGGSESSDGTQTGASDGDLPLPSSLDDVGIRELGIGAGVVVIGGAALLLVRQ